MSNTPPMPPVTASPARTRGILYVRWGPNNPILDRSVRSVKAIHPELPIHVQELPANATLLDKALMLAYTPFDETVFLDVDTVVLDRLDFGFQMAVKHGLACCICECPWARRYGGIQGDLVEYNTGVLFFTRAAKPIFDGWIAKVRTVDSSIRFINAQRQLAVMPYNDQAGFSLAVHEAEVPPFILPFNWNLRPIWHRSFWGPVKIWHDYSDPPPALAELVRNQSRPDVPLQYVRLQ